MRNKRTEEFLETKIYLVSALRFQYLEIVIAYMNNLSWWNYLRRAYRVDSERRKWDETICASRVSLQL